MDTPTETQVGRRRTCGQQFGAAKGRIAMKKSVAFAEFCIVTANARREYDSIVFPAWREYARLRTNAARKAFNDTEKAAREAYLEATRAARVALQHAN
jgi:hypothetical protein